jgi:replicative DNA helicase
LKKDPIIPQLPCSIEAEEGLLGSVLIDPDALALVLDQVRAEDFYRDAHRTVFDAMIRLSVRRTPADLITLCEELERCNRLDDVGGASTIVSLVNVVPTSANVVHYAAIVAQKALCRRLIHAAGTIAALAYEEESDALEKAEQALFALSCHTSSSEVVPISQVLQSCFDRLHTVHEHRGEVIGVPTGFRDLDAPLGGLQRSDLVILAARPGVGKTALALNIAVSAAYASARHVAFFSLEMGKEQLGLRLLSMRSHVDQMRLRMGWVEDAEWGKLTDAMTGLSSGPIWIDDTGGLALSALCSRARRLHAEVGLDLVIVDYLQLIHVTGDGKRYQNREQEIAEISRGLKALAKELDVPVLALAQLSRAVESRASKVPQLSDLRESGAIENDADVVLFIYREDMYGDGGEDVRKNTADIIIAKHRNGPIGTITLGFEAKETRFYPIASPLEEEV